MVTESGNEDSELQSRLCECVCVCVCLIVGFCVCVRVFMGLHVCVYVRARAIIACVSD